MENKEWIFKNFILFIVGFCVYITIEVCFRGYSFPLMGIVGGIDFILIDKINDRISWHIGILIQGIIGSAIITLSELIVGTIDRLYLHLNMWDYSNLPFNYNGVICLEFSLLWIIMAVVAVFLADMINYYVLYNETRPHYHFLKWIFYMPERKSFFKE